MDAKLNEVEINGTKYVPKGSEKQDITGDIKIVVLQRGWVMVGRFERNGSDCKLHNSSTIRTWGTTKGLGELAESGPLSATKLDKNNGLVEFDYLTVIASVSCREEKWENVL